MQDIGLSQIKKIKQRIAKKIVDALKDEEMLINRISFNDTRRLVIEYSISDQQEMNKSLEARYDHVDVL
jgi:hypothetical protein